NGWPTSVGFGGRIASESVAGFRRNTQSVCPPRVHFVRRSGYLSLIVGGEPIMISQLGYESGADRLRFWEALPRVSRSSLFSPNEFG
ncbi:hypothetical protein ACVSQB_42165, partial [Bradyrhizobium elkanii]